MSRAAAWAGLALALNLVWEIAQLPLYTIYRDPLPRIAYAVAHCTAGDVLIALASYGLAALLTRTPRWPSERPLGGTSVAVLAAVGYTVFSEWFNVSVRGAWAYAPSMPALFGIGLSPVLQWVVVPILAVVLVRRRGP